MVDLETLGLSPDSVIVSVGAVVFTKDGIESEGYWPLTLDQSDRNIDLGTLKWWMQQNEAARAVFAEKRTFSLRAALENLSMQFCDGTRIWSNGANFDEVLLTHAYAQLRIRKPWDYKHVRCYRTIRAQFPDIKLPSNGTKHNALDDARYQALTLIEIMKQKNIDLE